MNNFYWLVFLLGLFFQSASLIKVNILKFLKPFTFPVLSYYLLNILFSFHILDQDLFTIQKNIIIGLGFSFCMGSLFSLNEKNEKNIDLLIFGYFGLAILLTLANNIFHIFIIFELLTVLGVIFIILDVDVKNYFQLKDIALRYFITHCFAGLIFFVGIGVIYNFHSPTFFLSDIKGSNICVGHYLVFIALLINAAIPVFSSWLIQGYSVSRFSLSFILFAVMTKVSLFFMMIIANHLNVSYLLEIIGLITMIYGSILLFFETNIRRFICYAAISHNGLFLLLISKFGIFDKELIYKLFGDLVLSSMIIQNLFLSLIFTITQNTRSYFFIDIEKNISKYKFLFILTIVVNFIVIGMPLTPSFQVKNLIFSSINSNWNLVVYLITIINIIAHLFIFPFKIFKKKYSGFSSNYFSFSEYIKNLTFTFIPLLFLFFFSNKISVSIHDFHKYMQFIVGGGIVFIIFHKLLSRSRKVILDFDFIFYWIKFLLKMIVEKWVLFYCFLSHIIKTLFEEILIINHKMKLSSYNLIFLFFFFYITYVLVSFVEF